MPGVYLILCEPTGEYYIGGTRKLSFHDRFLRHQSWLRRGKAAVKLQAAYDKYGPEAFKYIPLRELAPDLVREREAQLLRELRPALNTKYMTGPAEFVGPRWRKGPRPRRSQPPVPGMPVRKKHWWPSQIYKLPIGPPWLGDRLTTARFLLDGSEPDGVP